MWRRLEKENHLWKTKKAAFQLLILLSISELNLGPWCPFVPRLNVPVKTRLPLEESYIKLSRMSEFIWLLLTWSWVQGEWRKQNQSLSIQIPGMGEEKGGWAGPDPGVWQTPHPHPWKYCCPWTGLLPVPPTTALGQQSRGGRRGAIISASRGTEGRRSSSCPAARSVVSSYQGLLAFTAASHCI